MKYRIKTRTATGVRTYCAIGELGQLLDAAYDDGALGVSVTVLP